MSEPRDSHDWERRYGGTIYHTPPAKPERSHRRLWAILAVAAVALIVFAALLGVSR